VSQPLAIVIAIAIGVIAVAVGAAVVALLPLIRQARETLSRVDTLIQSTEGDVRLTLSELRSAVHNLNQLSAEIFKNVDKVTNTAEVLRGLGETISNTSDIIRTTAHPRLLVALLVGLKTGRYLLRKIFSKKRR